METRKKQYVSPLIEVVVIENEGVIASSDNGGTVPIMPGEEVSSATNVPYSGSSEDLESMIEDILTY